MAGKNFGGTIAGMTISGIRAALIGFGISILFSRQRRGGNKGKLQTATESNDSTQRYWTRGTETVRRPSIENIARELPANEYRRAEL